MVANISFHMITLMWATEDRMAILPSGLVVSNAIAVVDTELWRL